MRNFNSHDAAAAVRKRTVVTVLVRNADAQGVVITPFDQKGRVR